MKKGYSIGYILRDRQQEIWAVAENPASFERLKQKVDEILDDPRLTDYEEVNRARNIFKKAGKNYNYYISCLTAYITSISASK